MSWVFFAISATIIWAFVNIIDKYALVKLVKKPIIPAILCGVLSLAAGIAVYLAKGFEELSYFNIFLAIAAGMVYILMLLSYFKAVMIEEISRVIPLFYLAPIFVLSFAFVFLGEVFSFLKYLGIFFLVSGAVLMSSRHPFKIRLKKSFWLMIFSALALAINSVIIKYLLNFADFWTVFSYVRIGTFISIIPLAYIYFKDMVKVNRLGFGLMTLAEILNLFGVFFITIAAASGFITLVSSLSSVQPLFVLIFALILSIFYPRILKEEINKTTLIQKFIAITLIIIGAILVI
jgi:drug/metabolite transporter (DMT)-like permease